MTYLELMEGLSTLTKEQLDQEAILDAEYCLPVSINNIVVFTEDYVTDNNEFCDPISSIIEEGGDPDDYTVVIPKGSVRLR